MPTLVRGCSVVKARIFQFGARVEAHLNRQVRIDARVFHHAHGMAFDDLVDLRTRIVATRDAMHEGFQTYESIVVLGRLGQRHILEEYIQYCC